jgi:hypothetical protein
MRFQSKHQPANLKKQNQVAHRAKLAHSAAGGSTSKPVAAYRQRVSRPNTSRAAYNAPEAWHEPQGDGQLKFIRQHAGAGYMHPITADEVRDRLAQLPERFTQDLEVVQFSRMTRKRRTFPCYGMQWGQTVYLYPIEESLVEAYVTPPKPCQQIEARMFGATWAKSGSLWTLTWTEAAIKDFYLNNVLIHEVGHINDPRNSNFRDRERYANWFAIEYGYRASRQ